MNPKKEGPIGTRIKPRKSAGHGPVAATLEKRWTLVQSVPVGLIVVQLKTAREPPHGVQDERADERRRPVAVLPQDFGKRRDRCRKTGGGEITDTVEHRVGPGKNDNVRRKGEGHRGVRLFEPNPFSCQLVYRRCLNLSISVTGDVVGSHCVECNQYHRRRPPLRSLGKVSVVLERGNALPVEAGGRSQKAQQIPPTPMPGHELYYACAATQIRPISPSCCDISADLPGQPVLFSNRHPKAAFYHSIHFPMHRPDDAEEL